MSALLLAQGLVWKVQTDWMGGPGVLGSVQDWGTRYWQGDSITAAIEGQVSLVAKEWDYTRWERVDVNTNGIVQHTSGFMGADLDSDGMIDLVGYGVDTVFWYKRIGAREFEKNPIVELPRGGDYVSTWLADLDNDNDTDIVYCSSGSHLGWLENVNDASAWVKHSIADGIFYRTLSAADFDKDGNVDILTVQRIGTDTMLKIFWGPDFSEQCTLRVNAHFGTRSYPGDFDGDGWPDLYYRGESVIVFLNNHDRTFYYVNSFPNFYDGAWVSDIDMDGDLDLILGAQNTNPGIYALLNTGAGITFNLVRIMDDPSNDYTDGGVVADIDLDGFPDIGGTCYSVGWLKQENTSEWPDTPRFTLYEIETGIQRSHWIYAQSLQSNKCTPSIDILISGGEGQIVYFNDILQSFASSGELTSSVLDLYQGSEYGHPAEFYYKACVPNDSALEFYFRGGATVEACTSASWIGPFKAQPGVDSASLYIADSFGCIRYFQYKVEFKGDTSEDKDIAVLQEVGLGYELCPYGVDEAEKAPRRLAVYTVGRSTLKLELPYSSKVRIEVYEPTGRLVTRIEKALQAGVHEIAIPGKGLKLARVVAGGREFGLKAF